MTLFKPVRKATLLIPSGSIENPDALHLHVILTDACADGLHLLGSISTIRPGQFHDPACLIQAGEHDFIKHESYFVYRRLTTFAGLRITKGVTGWEFRPRGEISEDLFTRIRAGMEVSQFVARGMRSYWLKNKPP